MGNGYNLHKNSKYASSSEFFSHICFTFFPFFLGAAFSSLFLCNSLTFTCFLLELLQDTKFQLKLFVLCKDPFLLFLLTPKTAIYKIKVHCTFCYTHMGWAARELSKLNFNAQSKAPTQIDQKQDLDSTNTVTQQGT